jgi:hypothetical protein
MKIQSSQEEAMNKTWKSVTAGIVSIIGGVIGMLEGVRFFVRASHAERIFRHMGLEVIGFFCLVLAVIAIAGGIVALLRKNWGFALAGAICAIFLVPFVPGVLATIFLSLSKNEFGPAKSA